MKKTVLIAMTGFSMLFAGCGGAQKASHGEAVLTDSVPADFKYEVDAFADLQILRYYVPGFNNLSLQQKELVYYLSMAAIEGRDILYDQNNKLIKDCVNQGQYVHFSTSHTPTQVYIDYYSIPVDEDGFPLIKRGYEAACYAYCVYKLFDIGRNACFLRGKIHRGGEKGAFYIKCRGNCQYGFGQGNYRKQFNRKYCGNRNSTYGNFHHFIKYRCGYIHNKCTREISRKKRAGL